MITEWSPVTGREYGAQTTIERAFNGIFAKPDRWFKAGIIATIFLAIFMEGIARIVLGGPMKPASLIAQALGWDNSLLWVAQIMHCTLGVIVFPIGYIVAMGVTGMRGDVISDALWGVVLWIAASTIMMSLAGAPLFFGFGKAMIASPAAHVAYGGVFGGESIDPAPSEKPPTRA